MIIASPVRNLDPVKRGRPLAVSGQLAKRAPDVRPSCDSEWQSPDNAPGFSNLWCCFDVKRISHPSGSRRGDILPAPSGPAAPEKPQYPRMAKLLVQSQGYPHQGANLKVSSCAGRSSQTAMIRAVTATIRESRIFTIPHFRCPPRQHH